jgi:Skp family chaperone for outer membrane proteins
MKKLFFISLLAFIPLRTQALELLLEENRGESGTIGYVDIDRVFKEYSGTTGAREEFISEIKKKEDAVNAKKTAIFTLKAEIAKLRQEREFALTLPSLLETQRSVAEASEIKVSSPPVQVSTDTAQISTSAPAALPRDMQNLPGMDGIDMPGIVKVPVNRFKFSVSTSVPEIDLALAKKDGELKLKEEELRVFQRLAERELLEYESHKGEILLGRIYVALKELAGKEEVSVIVDKRNILFGQNAVDLTGKLLKKLEEDGI